MSRGMRPGWRHFVRGIACGAAVLAAAGGVAGCGSKDPKPAATLTPPLTASATPSPTPTPTPTLPPEQIPPTAPAALTDVGADGATKDQAIQVAEYFLALYAYVYATHDVEPWQALSDVGCNFCASVVSNVNAAAVDKTTLHGGVVSLASPSVLEGIPGELFTIDATATQEPSQVIDENGATLDERPQAEWTMEMVLRYTDGRWAVLGITTDS